MSLISSFVANQLIKEVEKEMISHTPEMKALAIQEMEEFGNQVLDWVKNKLGGSDAVEEGKQQESDSI